MKNVCVVDYFGQTEMLCIIESINSHARDVGGSRVYPNHGYDSVCAFVKGNRVNKYFLV